MCLLPDPTCLCQLLSLALETVPSARMLKSAASWTHHHLQSVLQCCVLKISEVLDFWFLKLDKTEALQPANEHLCRAEDLADAAGYKALLTMHIGTYWNMKCQEVVAVP